MSGLVAVGFIVGLGLLTAALLMVSSEWRRQEQARHWPAPSPIVRPPSIRRLEHRPRPYDWDRDGL